ENDSSKIVVPRTSGSAEEKRMRGKLSGNRASANRRQAVEVRMTILITGATGQVGREAAADLARTGAAVRALVRDPSRFAAPPGVEVVQGSFDDDASISRAVRGIEAML